MHERPRRCAMCGGQRAEARPGSHHTRRIVCTLIARESELRPPRCGPVDGAARCRGPTQAHPAVRAGGEEHAHIWQMHEHHAF